MNVGLREQVKEFRKCFGAGENDSTGLAEVPTVDGSGVKSWAGLRRKIAQLYGEGPVMPTSSGLNVCRAVFSSAVSVFCSLDVKRVDFFSW